MTHAIRPPAPPAFHASESGAVTVDWVVLTAALVGLGLAVMGVLSGAARTTTTDVAAEIDETLVYTSFDQRAFPDFLRQAQKAVASHPDGTINGMSGADYVDFTADWIRTRTNLQAQVDNAAANRATWQGRADAMGGMIGADASYADIAAQIPNSDAAAVEAEIRDTFNDDKDAMLRHRIDFSEARVLREDVIVTLAADEFGIVPDPG